MTPAARIAAAIELVAELQPLERPADQVVAGYLRHRRYIGGGDRRRLLELCYGVLRHWARLHWWLARVESAPSPRALVIAYLILVEEWSADHLAGSFDGQRYNPERLSDEERALAKALQGASIDHSEMPRPVALECPEWLYPGLEASFGAETEAALKALLTEAPTDLRVNTLKATREEAQAALKAEGIEAEATPISPVGLRLEARAPIASTAAFKQGLIEVQDEASQVVALVAGAAPGLRVCDFCAGAGGKTLALAAQMANKGQLLALDVLKGRLDRAQTRIKRAGFDNIERRVISDHRDPWLKRRKGKFHRVLIDAPCTGIGTWRRNPDARWRTQADEVARLAALQAEILESAQRLVRPGGRLVYATCSLLSEENEARAEAFLEAHPEFEILPVAEAWAEAGIAGPAPEDRYLRLSPHRHGTDGFFAALFQRRDESAK